MNTMFRLVLVLASILIYSDTGLGLHDNCRCKPERIHLNVLINCPPEKAQPDGRFQSNATVHGGPGTCKSPCKISPEGFSYCDTISLFYRDSSWYDWDLCSMCDSNDPDKFYTPYLRECARDGKCSNIWSNRDQDAPRCMTTQGLLDYCTMCTAQQGESSLECPTFRPDEKTGLEQGSFGLWVQPNPKEKIEEKGIDNGNQN
ncbi:uncharacterized protein LOC111699429 [Eurytemora carolleeae]|uniref:uncharacterized protein LOC111699429 n=1 Tax=Eurytemora carolleeae TaxID=1294199 RepID=UPI000C756B95|nr:uncharacterized protein LOC111699429 [Eurytemora carolleeae]|eukprot:XP_023325878.1 uncharacterized protein LOC111699429 [Eurytemora affinis]